MKIRYKQTDSGPIEVARVYSADEHKIDLRHIDKNAVRVVETLSNSGFEAYIVGGAVRDLLLGLFPKDFDVVTSASPRQVHRIFHNSRIIGRRFKIVHVVFGNKIIEVSTFRSTKEHKDKSDNVFGTIEEDASRRDFSINSLYYNPFDETIIDFNNAFKDFKQKKITSLIPVSRTFIEDPVRMIRAIKFSVTTSFKLRFSIRRAIRNCSSQLLKVSNSRLTEELNKILACGFSSGIIRELNKYKILVYILPCISVYADDKSLYSSLAELDNKAETAKNNNVELSKSDMYLALVSPFILINEDTMTPYESYKDIFRQIKVLLSPNTPSNTEVEEAVYKFMKKNKLRVPKSSTKKNTAVNSAAKD